MNPVNHIPPHPNAHRSRSDEGIHHPGNPIRGASRSSSFSVSRAPHPQWDNNTPPPPVPPLPRSLLPRSHGPALAHANRDLSFMEVSHSNAPNGRPWTTFLPNSVSAPYDMSRSVPPQPAIPSRPPDMPRFYLDPSSSFTPPPVLPSRPTPTPVSNTPGPLYRHPSFYGFNENFYLSSDRSSSPPPAVPPRPPTSHDEIRSGRSLSLRSQHLPPPPPAPSPPPLPPLPPKPLTSSAIPPPFSSSLERIPTPHSQISTTSSSSNTPPDSQASEKADASVETETLDDLPLDSDSDLKRALTLSLMESKRQVSTRRTLEDEENDLSRALAESLSLSFKLDSENVHVVDSSFSQTATAHPKSEHDGNITSHPEESGNVSYTQDHSQPKRAPSKTTVPFPSGRDILSPEELEDHQARGQIIQELEDEEVTRRLQGEIEERERQEAERMRRDEEITKQLQEEEARRLEAEKLERERRDEERARQDEELARRQAREEKAMKLIREAQERKDAEMARMLAETGQRPRRKSTNTATSSPKQQPPPPPPQPTPADVASAAKALPSPPQYDDVVRTPVPSEPKAAASARPGRAASAHAAGPATQPVELLEVVRTSSVTATTAVRGGKNGPSAKVAPPGAQTSSPAGTSKVEPSRVDPALLAAQQDNALGPDVLMGVSYGFTPPDTYTVQTKSGAQPSCPPFPEVVSLERAPCQPFHIMAPSWRQLLRLLAQLDTRIEANLDAIMQSKTEYQLRVVVQFVKLSYTANTWRTILHLTVDEPVPANLANRWRYTNGDTTVLPYSYTLGAATPYLVNDNKDSHFYVIPLSASSPFPILPITLPNLALYLRSAMQDSRARRVQNDTSNTIRRLAKIVGSCYPEEAVGADSDGKPARGMGGFIKRVVGRGSGSNRDTLGNEEFSDIISPFRIDQYTAS